MLWSGLVVFVARVLFADLYSIAVRRSRRIGVCHELRVTLTAKGEQALGSQWRVL